MLPFFNIAVLAQTAQETTLNKIGNIYISTTKTTTIIFPRPITFIDQGTDDILVQRVTTAENILLIKARIPYFKETNITVISSDGSLFSSVVKYDSASKIFNYTLKNVNSNRPLF